MGCLLSKSDSCSISAPNSQQINPKPPQKVISSFELDQPICQVAAINNSNNTTQCIKTDPKQVDEKTDDGKDDLVSKKIESFGIQHRNSNDKGPQPQGGLNSDGSASNSNSSNPVQEEVGRTLIGGAASGQVVRDGSCTKEEVDDILIKCGKLSLGKGESVGHGRRYSGSKRSFDFDKENDIAVNDDDLIDYGGERSRPRQPLKGSNRRRETLSRSREREHSPQQHRSGSRDRNHGRRVSRSPGRRSQSPIVSHSSSNSNNSTRSRSGKLVSVPITVTALSVDKANVGDGGNVKRVLVKRNVGSPRSQSPSRTRSPGRGVNQGNGHDNGGLQAVSLCRNGSRKAEHSPYRRTPLNEIDTNSLPFHPLSSKKGILHKGKELVEDVALVKQPVNSGFQQNKFTETSDAQPSTQGTHRRTSSRGAEGYEVTKTNYCRVNEHQTPKVQQIDASKREHLDTIEYDSIVSPLVSAIEMQIFPQTMIRSRSRRRSRDLDINFEALLDLNPATNYNSLLLQDIQNFHQKNCLNSSVNSCSDAVSASVDSSTPPFSLPSYVTKAHSILEEVADLNSTTVGSNLKSSREPIFSFNNNNKSVDQSKDPFVESEVKVGDDLLEPSLHKYVTVRKRDGDIVDEESSGSNSFVGVACHQNWVPSSSREPTSADFSTDCTSKSYSKKEVSPVGFQKHAIYDIGCGTHEESERKFG